MTLACPVRSPGNAATVPANGCDEHPHRTIRYLLPSFSRARGIALAAIVSIRLRRHCIQWCLQPVVNHFAL